MIYDKIKSAFSIKIRNTCALFVQFWAPVTIGGRWLLSTSGQPFAVNQHSTVLNYYRLRSVEYQYSINLDTGQDPMIICGQTATAFLNHIPEIVNVYVGGLHWTVMLSRIQD